MKKTLIGLGLVLGAGLAQAQTGTMLDGVYVEKFHTATAADHIIDANLPIGAVTYRLFVDIKDGYRMSSVYGNADHALIFKTSTAFYNSPGGKTAGNLLANAPATVDNYDSWISMGGATGNKTGIPLVEDITDGTVDGYTTKSVATFAGITSTSDLVLDVFDGDVVGGNKSDFTNNVSVYGVQNSIVGATATNRVLIGQFTTDGTFEYALNFILVNSVGDAQNYVNGTTIVLPDPTTGEYTDATMTGNSDVLSLSVTPSTLTPHTGDLVALNAVAQDIFGDHSTVNSVEFFADGVSIGTDNSYPFGDAISYHTATTEKNVAITATATYNTSLTKTSDVVSLAVSNPAPVIGTFTGVPSGTVLVGTPITLTTTATDDGSIASVQFLVDGVNFGSALTTAPYTLVYTPSTTGTKSFTVVVTDEEGKTTTALPLTLVVNVAPSITLAASAPSVNLATPVTLTATAADANGTVSSVVFKDGTTTLATKTAAPYTFTTGNLTAGSHSFTAIVTDNQSATTTSTPATVVTAANAAPVVSLSASLSAVNLVTPVTLTATATDADQAIASVTFMDGATTLGTKTVAPYTYTTGNLTAGPHSFTAVATDSYTTAASSTSTAQVVTATNVNPTISISASAASVKEGASVTITATTADVDGIVTKVEFFEGTTSLGTVSPLVTSTLAVGIHTITAEATDNASGKTTSNAVTVTVAARIAPTVSFATSASSVNLATPITLTATTVNNDGSIASLEFFDGTTSLGTASLVATKTITAVPAGSHSYTVKAIDDKSAVIISAPALVTATNATPSISAITLSTVTCNAGEVITAQVTATDAETANLIVAFTGATFSSVTKLGNIYSATFNAASGTNTIAATATDANSGVATANSTIVTANALPTVSGITLSKAKPSVGDHIEVNVRASSTTTKIELYKDGSLLGIYTKSQFTLKALTADTYTDNGDGTYTFTFQWTATGGSNVFQAIAYNASNGGSSTSIATATQYTLPVSGVSFTKKYAIALSESDSTGILSCHAGDFLNVPIVKTTNDSIVGVTGFDIVVNYDKSKVTPTGAVQINNDLINHLFVGTTVDIKAAEGKMNISIYLNGTDKNATFNSLIKYTAGQNALVTSVEFVKNPTFRSIDTVLFSATIVESYSTYTAPAQVQPGQLSTYRNTNFKGDISFWADNSAIQFDTLNPTAHLITNIVDGLKTTQPDLNGMFNISNLTNNLTITRDIASATDVMPVINGYDALLTAEVAVENVKFVPTVYQIIAMDVNRDGKISAGDVSQINLRTVLSIDKFTQVDNLGKDWLFVNKADVATKAEYKISSLYPLADGKGYAKDMVPSVPAILSLADNSVAADFVCASTRESFVGILVGDANGNYKNITTANTADYSKLKSNVVSAPVVAATVVFDYAKATVSTVDGVKYLDIPVVVSSDLDVNSLDFALTYDATNLQYNSIVSTDAAIKTLANVGDDNTLRFTSYSFTGFATGVTVVSVRFELKSDVVAPISTAKAYVNGEPVASEISTNGHGFDATVLTANVYPNPASDVINVVVSQTSKIEVINVLTQSVYTLETAVPNQIHVINTSSFAKGAYYVKVTGASSSITKVIAIQ